MDAPRLGNRSHLCKPLLQLELEYEISLERLRFLEAIRLNHRKIPNKEFPKGS